MLYANFLLIVAAVCGLAACSPSASPPESAPKQSQPSPPPDLTALFPPKDRVDVRVVTGHVLDKDVLPGGNVASYESGKRTWQLFLVQEKSAEAAAILLLNYKTTLTDPKYVGSFGAYYGIDAGKPVFVLQKGSYLAGIVGLTDKQADPVAREFAARLN